jgi:putative peptidoglycan lipid II flippase
MKEHGTLLRSASLVSVLTLVSRVFGYFRDQRIAFLLGAGVEFDAYTIAYRIPNLLRRLVGEGAVSAAFIPIFSDYLSHERREEAWRFAGSILTILTFLMAVVTVVGVLFAPLVVLMLASGVDERKLELATLLTRIMMPYIFLVSLAALAMGVLNSFHKFAASAAAPICLNLGIITFSFLTDLFPSPEIALAVGVVVGGIGQVAIQAPAVWRMGLRFRSHIDLSHPGIRRTGKLMAPLVAGAGVVQINVLVDTQFASYMGNGPQSALFLGDRVMELVLGGYAIAISTVILPMMSRSAASGALDAMRTTINFASRMILLVAVPAAVGLVVLATPIIQVLFEHGEFDAADTALTAIPLVYFAVGLVAFSMMKVIVPAFYALKDTRTPVKIAFLSMLLNVALNFAFFEPLQVGGPALATSLAAFFSAITLVYLFVRRQGSIGVSSIAGSLGRFMLASLGMGLVAAWLINRPGFYFDQALGQRILALGATIAASAGVYFTAVWVLRSPELREVRAVLARRRQGEVS